MTAYSYKISLRMRHPSRSPSDVTAALGIQPRYSGVAGDQRTGANGQPLGSIWAENYWSARIEEGAFPGKDLAIALAQVSDVLAPHERFLVDFVADGGRAELFVGWYFPHGSSGEILSFELLARLASLKLDLSWDVYPNAQA